MINNKYKKYYSKVLPDQKLVEDTKEKMLEELMKEDIPQKPPIKVFSKYMAAAACVAFSVAAVLMIPDLQKKVPTADTQMCQTQTGTQCCNDSQTDKTRSESKATYTNKSAYNKNTDQTISKSSESAVTAVPSDHKSTAADTIKNENKKQNQTHRQTEKVVADADPAVSQKQDNITPVQTEPVKETHIEVSTAPQTNPVTTDTNIKAGLTGGPEIVTTHSDPGSTPVKPDYSEITLGANTINLNNAFEYEYNIPNERRKVNMDEVYANFGTQVIPQQLMEQYPESACWADKYDTGFSSGIGFIFGTESPFYRSETSFISVNVAKTDPEYGYSFKCQNPVNTEINGCSYYIGKLCDSSSEIYYCKFSKNNIYYNLCFKGYSIEDAVQTILMF